VATDQAFQGNRSQREITQELRKRLKGIGDIRMSIRNPADVQPRWSELRRGFRAARTGPRFAMEIHRQLRQRGTNLASLTPTRRFGWTMPELRVEIDPERAAKMAWMAANRDALRIMVGGDPRVSRFRDLALNEDYDVQLRLREGQRNDLGAVSRLYVSPRGGGLCGSTTWCV